LGAASTADKGRDSDRTNSWVSPIGGAPTADPERAGNASAFFAARQAAAKDNGQSSGLPKRRPDPTRPNPGRPNPARPNPGAGAPGAGPAQRANSERDDTPIFRQISSRWLDADGEQLAPWSTGETDQAWEAAQVATDEHSSDGDALPQRRPGRYIVPGSVERAESVPTRDPEALRAKLSRYKAGVERARESTTSTQTGKANGNDNGNENDNHNDTDNGSRPR